MRDDISDSSDVGTLRATKYIHNHLLKSVLHWPTAVFDRIPSGRVMNRFGSDIDILDNVLPKELLELLKDTATVSELLAQTFLCLPKELPPGDGTNTELKLPKMRT